MSKNFLSKLFKLKNLFIRMTMSNDIFRNFLILILSLCIVLCMYKYSATNQRFLKVHKLCEENGVTSCIGDAIKFQLELILLGASVLFMKLLFNTVWLYWDKAMMKNLSFIQRIAVNTSFIEIIAPFILFFNALLQGDGFVDVLVLLILVVFLAAFIFFCCLLFSYDDVDIFKAVNNVEMSIGATYAIGAYYSYYEKILPNFNSHVQNWEAENKSTVPMKKLIIICPLSCNVDGNLKQRCENNLEIKSDFISHICDQGANINRKYKHTVYEIQNHNYPNGTLVIAQFGSPIGVLWEQRTIIEENKLVYIRDCFIFTLKHLLKNLPSLVVVYEDDPGNSLDRFLLSVVEQELRNRRSHYNEEKEK